MRTRLEKQWLYTRTYYILWNLGINQSAMELSGYDRYCVVIRTR